MWPRAPRSDRPSTPGAWCGWPASIRRGPALPWPRPHPARTVMDLDGAHRRVLGSGSEADVAWAADGSRLVVGGAAAVQVYDAATLAPSRVGRSTCRRARRRPASCRTAASWWRGAGDRRRSGTSTASRCWRARCPTCGLTSSRCRVARSWRSRTSPTRSRSSTPGPCGRSARRSHPGVLRDNRLPRGHVRRELLPLGDRIVVVNRAGGSSSTTWRTPADPIGVPSELWVPHRVCGVLAGHGHHRGRWSRWGGRRRRPADAPGPGAPEQAGQLRRCARLHAGRRPRGRRRGTRPRVPAPRAGPPGGALPVALHQRPARAGGCRPLARRPHRRDPRRAAP